MFPVILLTTPPSDAFLLVLTDVAQLQETRHPAAGEQIERSGIYPSPRYKPRPEIAGRYILSGECKLDDFFNALRTSLNLEGELQTIRSYTAEMLVRAAHRTIETSS